jgi:hypothetical protein
MGCCRRRRIADAVAEVDGFEEVFASSSCSSSNKSGAKTSKNSKLRQANSSVAVKLLASLDPKIGKYRSCGVCGCCVYDGGCRDGTASFDSYGIIIGRD